MWKRLRNRETYGIRPRSCRSGTHHAVEEHRSSGVPVLVSLEFITALHNMTYEFDGHLLVVQKVGALEDDTERTFTDLLAHAVVDTHYV